MHLLCHQPFDRSERQPQPLHAVVRLVAHLVAGLLELEGVEKRALRFPQLAIRVEERVPGLGQPRIGRECSDQLARPFEPRSRGSAAGPRRRAAATPVRVAPRAVAPARPRSRSRSIHRRRARGAGRGGSRHGCGSPRASPVAEPKLSANRAVAAGCRSTSRSCAAPLTAVDRLGELRLGRSPPAAVSATVAGRDGNSGSSGVDASASCMAPVVCPTRAASSTPRDGSAASASSIAPHASPRDSTYAWRHRRARGRFPVRKVGEAAGDRRRVRRSRRA